jgi:AbrB family looped-hinge helix DNA binding protein
MWLSQVSFPLGQATWLSGAGGVSTPGENQGHLELPSRRVYLTIVLPELAASMTKAERLMTVVSTKGQVILPKSIRQHRHWAAGTQLVVEETPEGVLLKAAPVFAPTRPDDVYGSLPYQGPPKTLEDMEASIVAEAKRRHASD